MNMGNLFNRAVDFLEKNQEKIGTGPSIGAQLLATGLPAYLSYLAAKEDAKKPGPRDPSEYMSAVDKFMVDNLQDHQKKDEYKT